MNNPHVIGRQVPSGTARRRTRALCGTALVVTLLVGGVAQSGVGRAASNVFASTSGTPAAADPTVSKRRVDLATPMFSDPTSITNPLFPVGDLAQVLQLGSDKDGSLRHEITLLPATRPSSGRDKRS